MQKRRRVGGLLGLTAATLLAFGCQGSSSFAELQESLTQIKDDQQTILGRLDRIEDKASGAGARPSMPDPNAKPQARPGRPNPSDTYKVPVGYAYTKGPDTAKVTIVQWSDFQCPFCNRVNPTLQQIQKDYGDDVRIAFKHNPLPMHDRAMAAALAAEAAGRQGKFWQMHDKLFANARELTDDNFETWAKELKLDVAKFKKDMNDPKLEAKIKNQQREGAGLGARGTPAFFINGRFLSGAQPVDAFKKLIDEEIKKAEKLLASGTPKDELYDTVIGKGKTKV